MIIAHRLIYVAHLLLLLSGINILNIHNMSSCKCLKYMTDNILLAVQLPSLSLDLAKIFLSNFKFAIIHLPNSDLRRKVNNGSWLALLKDNTGFSYLFISDKTRLCYHVLKAATRWHDRSLHLLRPRPC